MKKAKADVAQDQRVEVKERVSVQRSRSKSRCTELMESKESVKSPRNG